MLNSFIEVMDGCKPYLDRLHPQDFVNVVNCLARMYEGIHKNKDNRQLCDETFNQLKIILKNYHIITPSIDSTQIITKQMLADLIVAIVKDNILFKRISKLFISTDVPQEILDSRVIPKKYFRTVLDSNMSRYLISCVGETSFVLNGTLAFSTLLNFTISQPYKNTLLVERYFSWLVDTYIPTEILKYIEKSFNLAVRVRDNSSENSRTTNLSMFLIERQTKRIYNPVYVFPTTGFQKAYIINAFREEKLSDSYSCTLAQIFGCDIETHLPAHHGYHYLSRAWRTSMLADIRKISDFITEAQLVNTYYEPDFEISPSIWHTMLLANHLCTVIQGCPQSGMLNLRTWYEENTYAHSFLCYKNILGISGARKLLTTYAFNQLERFFFLAIPYLAKRLGISNFSEDIFNQYSYEISNVWKERWYLNDTVSLCDICLWICKMYLILPIGGSDYPDDLLCRIVAISNLLNQRFDWFLELTSPLTGLRVSEVQQLDCCNKVYVCGSKLGQVYFFMKQVANSASSCGEVVVQCDEPSDNIREALSIIQKIFPYKLVSDSIITNYDTMPLFEDFNCRFLLIEDSAEVLCFDVKCQCFVESVLLNFFKPSLRSYDESTKGITLVYQGKLYEGTVGSNMKEITILSCVKDMLELDSLNTDVKATHKFNRRFSK